MKRKVWAAFRRPKDIQGNSKRPKGAVMAVFWMSLGLDRNLVVRPCKVNFGKCGAPRKAVGVFLHVWDCVPFRDGASVESSVVSTGFPTAVLVGQ